VVAGCKPGTAALNVHAAGAVDRCIRCHQGGFRNLLKRSWADVVAATARHWLRGVGLVQLHLL
jgi:hypothetical protein